MLRFVRLLSLLLVLALGGLWVSAWAARAPGEGISEAFIRRLSSLAGADMPPPSAGGLQVAPVALGGDYALIDQQGRLVTQADFAGGFSLIYFGFTWCPDACPTELGTMIAALDLLGEEERRVTPIFITVDPERDTVPVMADYVARFHPRLVGLTGSPQQVAQAARVFRVYYAKAAGSGATDYLVDHSLLIYLTGPDGRVRQVFRASTTPEQMAAAIRAQLRAPAR